jgi:hypothetical protein
MKKKKNARCFFFYEDSVSVAYWHVALGYLLFCSAPHSSEEPVFFLKVCMTSSWLL